MSEQNQGPLSGVRVLDLTRVLSGPYGAMWLGDMGADVIKIELPVRGDDARYTPLHINGHSAFFTAMNRNKRSITLNLKSEKGKAMFLEMLKDADVVLSNYRPGVMEKLGLGYEDLKKVNERIIYATVSGFGQAGPYAQRPAYDAVCQAMGGIMAVTGPKDGGPCRVGTSLADVTAGMNMVTGVLAALYNREKTGKGQAIDVAMADSVIALMPSENMRYHVNGHHLVPRLGNSYIGNAPYGAFHAKDKDFIIGCGSDGLFAKFATNVLKRPDLPEDERFYKMEMRWAHYDELKEIIEDWSLKYTAKECVQQLLDAGIPTGPVLDMDDISVDEHFVKVREMLVKMEQPGIGEVTVTNNPIKFSETKTSIRRPAPLLGQHTEEVYRELLGLTKEDLDKLREEGII